MIKNFALRRFIVFNRLPIAAALIALGFLLGLKVTWWIAWIPFLIAALMIVAHFMVGPMTLLQTYMEMGDMEGAQALLKRVKRPGWLYKPLRSSYYMLRGQLSAATTEDLDAAEKDFKQSLASGMTEKGAEGTAYLQLGSIAAKKGNLKEAYEHLRQAVKLGLPDKDSEAMAYLQLSNLALNRRDFRGAKMYFSRAKSAKSTNKQVVDQISEMAKYMARIPG
jgi:tetratricopeptide (TPR) repeat protein